MTTIRETMPQEVAEGGSALITGYFEDELGAYIALAGIGTVRLWLYNDATGLVINSKTNVDIKNANNGTVAEVVEAGVTRTKFTLRLLPADNPIVDSTKRVETHVAAVETTYNGGAGTVVKEVLFRVRSTLF